MKVMIYLAILFTLAVSSSFAQDVADKLIVSPPNLCRLSTPVDIGDIARRLNSGELGSSAAAPAAEGDTAASVIQLFRCEDGPKRIIHSVNKEFHWPPIYRGTCDGLYCMNPPCFPRRTRMVTKCVHVFKLTPNGWVYAGRQTRKFIDHLKCGCKKCEDIKTLAKCIATNPCPNSGDPKSFCYWTLADVCKCCTPPFSCPMRKVFVREHCRCECPKIKCPPGQTLNSVTCKCDCPKGSRKNSAGQCVGDCGRISLKYCRFIQCIDNLHLKCQVDGYQCVCSSCDDVTDTRECTRTRCTEQKRKPRCKLDPCTRKCRCPRCEDQPEWIWCERTQCGSNYESMCKWDRYYKSCSCPH